LHVLSYVSGSFHLPTSFPPNGQIPPPTLNERAQKFFFQFHLSTQNMATLQHLPVISAGLSTNVCLVILGLCTFLFSGWISARRLNLPPGPTSVPFIGNLHQISFHGQELCFAQWGRIFGTVVFPSQLMRLVQQSERMDEQAMLYTLEYLDVPWSSSIPWKPLGTSWNSAASTIPVALALFFWSKCDLDPMAPPSIYPSLTCLIGWVGIRLFLSCRMVLDFANIVV
jgi:hypothetical protein